MSGEQAYLWALFYQQGVGIGRGAGVGLSVVYGIIKSLGGTMSVASELGEGAIFTIQLPWSDKASEPTQRVEVSETLALRVVLVEDDAPVRLPVAATMERMGAHVRQFESGKALGGWRDEASSLDLDALVTDGRMPGIDGHEVARLYGEQITALSVVLQTRFQPEAAKRALLENSMLLMKPARGQVLEQSLRLLCLSVSARRCAFYWLRARKSPSRRAALA